MICPFEKITLLEIYKDIVRIYNGKQAKTPVPDNTMNKAERALIKNIK